MSRNFILIVVVSAVVMAVIWLIDSPPQLQNTLPEGTDLQSLVQYSNQLHSVEYNALGLPEHQFSASRVEHRRALADADTEPTAVIFSQPDIVFYEQGRASWEVNAEAGRSEISDDDASESIYLEENVLIQQHTIKQPNTEPAKIETNALWIDIKDKHAYTDQAVKLSSPGAVITGIGLDASIKDENIKILANTKTHYERSN